MKARFLHSACWLWIALLSAAGVAATEVAFEPRTERGPAVGESPRGFARQAAARDLRAAFAADPRPLSLAAGDFDGDGMPDLAAGYAVEGGSYGLVALWRGNLDALFPWSPEARQRRLEGGFTEVPFLGPPALFAVPEPPDLLAVGRFDGDAHLDLLAAGAAAEVVYLLGGDGRGALAGPAETSLPALPAAWSASEEGPLAAEEPGPVAAVELRLNSDAFPDRVLLEAGSSRPWVERTVFDCSHTVNSTGDDEDHDLTDGVCDADPASAVVCTLRAAIRQGCSSGSNKEIRFSIPGSFQRVIAVGSELPPASETTIDGSTQAEIIAVDGGGSFVGDGLRLGNSSVLREIYVGGFGGSGVRTTGPGNVVEGCHIGKTSDFLIVSGGNLQGIEVGWSGPLIGGAAEPARNVVTGNGNFGIAFTNSGSTDGTIEGNYIGTNGNGDGVPTGTSPQPCGIQISGRAFVDVVLRGNLISGNDVGVCVSGLGSVGSTSVLDVVDNKIGTNADGTGAVPNRVGLEVSGIDGTQQMKVGGPTMADRNLISGNTEAGLELVGPLDGLLVHGNYIGTDMAGAAALANGLGVDVSGTSGPEIYGNLISGNTSHGLYLHGNSGTFLRGNFIGTDAAGTGALGNGSHGVWVTGASTDVSIAGDYAGGENRIAHNGATGVAVGGGSTGIDIIDNRIFANSRLGIDLVDALFLWDGVTPNDPLGDPDNGPNNLQNHPTITAVTATNVAGSLSSTPSMGFEIEVYTSASCDPSGHGEAETYYGTALITTGADGDEVWGLAAGAIPAGHYVTAIAWNPATGDTSEFSTCRRDDTTCPYPPHLVLSNGPVAGAQSFTACQTITTEGDFGVALSASVDLTAGESVELRNLEVLGEFSVQNDSALAVP